MTTAVHPIDDHRRQFVSDRASAKPATCHQQPVTPRTAFTLVEILVVIAIIGILAGLAIPAITIALSKGKVTAIKSELNSISSAIEKYEQKYGDYPPDFSSWPVIQRHYRKIFPRMSSNDATLLFNLVHTTTGMPPVSTFQAAEMDRAESLVWALGGYSDNIQRPFTGPGGPLVWVGNGSDTWQAPNGAMTQAQIDTARENPVNYQINNDRINQLHSFELSRLSFKEPSNTSAALTSTNKYLSDDDDDLFLTYSATTDGAPFLYFDSRTYSVYDPNVNMGSGDFNGYASTTFGVARPYFSDQLVANPTSMNYVSDQAALKGWRFVNPDTFQVISAGLDDAFGTIAEYDVQTMMDMNAVNEAIYFQYPTGLAISPRTDVDTPGELIVSGVSKFQESSGFGSTTKDNFQVDNITNFSRATIGDDVKE